MIFVLLIIVFAILLRSITKRCTNTRVWFGLLVCLYFTPIVWATTFSPIILTKTETTKFYIQPMARARCSPFILSVNFVENKKQYRILYEYSDIFPSINVISIPANYTSIKILKDEEKPYITTITSHYIWTEYFRILLWPVNPESKQPQYILYLPEKYVEMEINPTPLIK